MENKEFNPTIQAIVSIRHLALGVLDNWSDMKTIGEKIDSNLRELSSLVNEHGNVETKKMWTEEKEQYQYNLTKLKNILLTTTEKIREKKTDSLSNIWESHINYSENISKNIETMQTLGEKSLPENIIEFWDNQWAEVVSSHIEIKNKADAIGLQLQLIEEYKPEEVDELTDIILKHIPIHYNLEEAEKYNQEYMKAYRALKKEASQKKNLWDKFLDILAGGTQQTPAQRVMMQRWVNGEKGDNSL